MSKSYSGKSRLLKTWIEGGILAWQDYEWLMEEGADEKLQREVEEELRLAELERLMMQEEQASADLQVIF